VGQARLFQVDSLLYNIPFHGSVYKSLDSGKTWTAVSQGPTQFEALVRTSSGHLVGASYYGAFRSTDEGLSWEPVNDGLTETGVTTLALCKGFLFAGTAGGGVFRTNMDVSAWSPCSDGLGHLYVKSITVIDTVVIVTTRGKPGVYTSSNMGESWTPSIPGLPNSSFHSLLSVGRSVFMASDARDGVFQSTDNGTSWFPVNDGLPHTQVGTLVVSGPDLMATARGIWTRPLSQLVTGVPPVTHVTPACVSLSQNYPNPFNPVTTIQYVLPARSTVLLSVYNLLGQQVAVLEDGDREAGVHEVAFDAGRLASGVYFYRIIAGPFAATRKLLVVR